MTEINSGVVYVAGLSGGAIYDFNSGEIYSINNESCRVLNKVINNSDVTVQEIEYISQLCSNGLLNPDYDIHSYIPLQPAQSLKLCWLEITQLCNCKCVHCYEGNSHENCINPLSLNEWKSVIDQIALARANRVVIIGGEPCMHSQVDEIADYVSSKKIDTTIFSNGTCISPHLKEIVVNKKIRMKFSLYGHCEAVHDSITKVPGSFNKLISSIEYFLKNDVDVTVAVVLMRENEEYYKDIVSLLKTMGVKKYRFDVIREVFGGTQTAHIPVLPNIISSAKRTKSVFPKITKEKFDAAFYYNTCWNGKLVISEDGTILPCVFERNISLGNIRNSSLDDILSSKETAACWNLTYDNIDDCRNCEFRFACKDCRPLANSSKNPYAKSPRCTYDVQNGEWK